MSTGLVHSVLNPWERDADSVAFGPHMTLVKDIDYPADNNKMSWQDMLAWLREKRWQSLSFGGITYAALLVPGLNILMMPAAVAGATLFWVRERGEQALASSRKDIV